MTLKEKREIFNDFFIAFLQKIDGYRFSYAKKDIILNISDAYRYDFKDPHVIPPARFKLQGMPNWTAVLEFYDIKKQGTKENPSSSLIYCFYLIDDDFTVEKYQEGFYSVNYEMQKDDGKTVFYFNEFPSEPYFSGISEIYAILVSLVKDPYIHKGKYLLLEEDYINKRKVKREVKKSEKYYNRFIQFNENTARKTVEAIVKILPKTKEYNGVKFHIKDWGKTNFIRYEITCAIPNYVGKGELPNNIFIKFTIWKYLIKAKFAKIIPFLGFESPILIFKSEEAEKRYLETKTNEQVLDSAKVVVNYYKNL